MKLSELLRATPVIELIGSGDPEISGVHFDSRAAGSGGLFCALRGVNVDGHDFIPAAVSKGVAALVVERGDSVPPGIPAAVVANGRRAMAEIAAAFYGEPTAGVPLIGITGTNGKTTTTYLLEGILVAAGLPAAVLGTISYRFGATVLEASHTTPESTELQAALRRLADAGARAFVMEVSSHALEQHRVDGCRFDVGIFSNLTRDHLDYHGSMAMYLQAKQRLFAELLKPDALKPLRRAVVNMDDAYGPQIRNSAACPVITYGSDNSNDVHGIGVELSVDGISGRLRTPVGEIPFASKLLGRFNLSNIMAAAAAGVALDLPPAAIKAGIEGHLPVPGRLERVANRRGVTCLVDYAHTGDALANVLATVKEIATGRIFTVFGCGGDRDRGKRPIMGGVAVQYSDLAVVTSDNPRTEEPQAIIAEVTAGIPATVREYRAEELEHGFGDRGYVVVENRRDAIGLAARLAQPGDILLLAGKGHEDYQIIGTTKLHFDDREEAAAALGA